MTVNDMRDALMARYSTTIRNQRIDMMPDHQVIAIYKSMIARNDGPRRSPGIPKRSRLHEPERFEQTRMDFMNDQAS